VAFDFYYLSPAVHLTKHCHNGIGLAYDECETWQCETHESSSSEEKWTVRIYHEYEQSLPKLLVKFMPAATKTRG